MYDNWYKCDIREVNYVRKIWHINNIILIIKANDEWKLEDCIYPPSPLIDMKLSYLYNGHLYLVFPGVVKYGLFLTNKLEIAQRKKLVLFGSM